MSGEQSAEIAWLRAEVKHWKDHAQEAGEGFSQVCRDYARSAARNSELIRQIESLADEAAARKAAYPTHPHWAAWDAFEADLRELLLTPPGAMGGEQR